MLPPSCILLLVLHQGAPLIQPPPDAVCKQLQRIELALVPLAEAPEICVSPGLMTNFVFDSPVKVELQDEVRFQEMTRGRSTLSLLPPPDLVKGERLRLTATLGEGSTQQRVTFSLVGDPGRSTHQVEVYRDKRPREALQLEIAQGQAKNQQLLDELDQTRAQLAQLRVRLEQASGLLGLIANKTLSEKGIQRQELKKKELVRSEGVLAYEWGYGYRSDKSIAAELWLKNSSPEPWTAAVGSLVDAQGHEVGRMKLRQENPIEPNSEGSVIVEVDAPRTQGHGELMLWLRDENSRGITVRGLTFP
ncbi:uncharacterized protein (TIGR02268 family) [Archangium gephyra]|uniref:Uncharacterized protein (TIGR02268 family) n=1 Tax=Archangium gephyra TaxID=48 RepID=A0ABX9JXX3_9BACT|nr:DUF2381 family protein [Archangium gephyra]REG28943.1 uncharacterized protein (TIGR02268 family) [Archangium gephyra]